MSHKRAQKTISEIEDNLHLQKYSQVEKQLHVFMGYMQIENKAVYKICKRILSALVKQMNGKRGYRNQMQGLVAQLYLMV